MISLIFYIAVAICIIVLSKREQTICLLTIEQFYDTIRPKKLKHVENVKPIEPVVEEVKAGGDSLR